MNLQKLNRLSRPKYEVHCKRHTKYIINDKNTTKTRKMEMTEIIDLTNRLSHEKKRRVKTPELVSDSPRKSPEEIDKIIERVSRPLRRPKSPPPSQSTPKKLTDLENFIERLSTPKGIRERKINRNVTIEPKRKLNNNDITSLCERLADAKYAYRRTPDARRLLDRKFSPVNTYAWQGIAHNDIDWRFYLPQCME
jgi:hypothetical protein